MLMIVAVKFIAYTHSLYVQCVEFFIILINEDKISIIAQCVLTINNSGTFLSMEFQTVLMSFEVQGRVRLSSEK